MTRHVLNTLLLFFSLAVFIDIYIVEQALGQNNIQENQASQLSQIRTLKTGNVNGHSIKSDNINSNQDVPSITLKSKTDKSLSLEKTTRTHENKNSRSLPTSNLVLIIGFVIMFIVLILYGLALFWFSRRMFDDIFTKLEDINRELDSSFREKLGEDAISHHSFFQQITTKIDELSSAMASHEQRPGDSVYSEGRFQDLMTAINENRPQMANQLPQELHSQLEEFDTKLTSLSAQLKKPDYKEAKKQLINYYKDLIIEIITDYNCVGNSGGVGNSDNKVINLGKNLKSLKDICSPATQEMINTFLADVKKFKPIRPSANQIQKKINSLMENWGSLEKYRIYKLSKDKEEILSGRENVFFNAELFRSYHIEQTRLDCLEKEIRRTIAESVPLSSTPISGDPQKLISSFRSKIVSLVGAVDEDLLINKTGNERDNANNLIHEILDCLALEELPVAVGREEFDDSKHMKVGGVRSQDFEHNTVIEVCRRGLRDKISGAVHVKAQVKVSNRIK